MSRLDLASRVLRRRAACCLCPFSFSPSLLNVESITRFAMDTLLEVRFGVVPDGACRCSPGLAYYLLH